MWLQIFTSSSLKESREICTWREVVRVRPVWLQSSPKAKYWKAQIVKAWRCSIQMHTLSKNIQHQRHLAQTQQDQAHKTWQTQMSPLWVELLGEGQSERTREKKAREWEVLLRSLWEVDQYFWKKEASKTAQETGPTEDTAWSRWSYSLWPVWLQSQEESLLQ